MSEFRRIPVRGGWRGLDELLESTPGTAERARLWQHPPTDITARRHDGEQRGRMKHIFALVRQRHLLVSIYYVVTMPISIMVILNSRRIHPAYKITWLKKLRLGWRYFLNGIRIRTGTTYKTHLVMALKLLETPPEIPGDVIECGTWKGGSAANLSLVCRMVGRKLKIFDSFEGLPAGDAMDREAKWYKRGDYAGSLEEVRTNIAKYGAPERCEYVRGWFNDTLPKLDAPVILAFLDVDLEASLDTCVRHIYPHLAPTGHIFIDEVTGTDYCSLFYSERWWRENFERTPPGLIGAGTGLALGEFYIGPGAELSDHPMQHSNAGAYMRKDMSGYWSYYPADVSQANRPKAGVTTRAGQSNASPEPREPAPASLAQPETIVTIDSGRRIHSERSGTEDARDPIKS